MLTRTKRRLLAAGVISIITAPAIWIMPAGIEGCYLEAGEEFNATAGYSFTYFHAGDVYSCNEYRSNAAFLGTYSKVPGVGWVWALQNSKRCVLVKPKLLYVKFEPTDQTPQPATAAFQWRDPRITKTQQVLRSVPLNHGTNAIQIEPALEHH